jgi:hypothetical protein
MRRLMFTVAVVLVSTTFKATADELPDSTVQGLALQYMYMELCKDIAPPLPPDRLRVVDALTEIVDREALLKAVVTLQSKLKLDPNDKDKVATFCSNMATMIKNEKHEKE